MSGDNRSGNGVDDPFEELARMIEEPFEPIRPQGAAQGSQPSTGGASDQDDDLAASLESVLGDFFGDDDRGGGVAAQAHDTSAPARPMVAQAEQRPEATPTQSAVPRRRAADPHPQAAAYAAWLQPGKQGVGRIVGPSADTKAAREAATAAEGQNAAAATTTPADPMAEAFAALSSPRALNELPPETAGQFAPEAADPDELDQGVTGTVDAFDELIASELAAMELDQPGERADEDAVFIGGENSETVATADTTSNAGAADSAIAGAGQAGRARLSSRPAAKRGSMRFGGIAASLVLAGVGAFYWTSGPSVGGDGEVLLVQADSEPVKVRPDDPGGRSIPNQEQVVYDRVQSPGETDAPGQAKLDSTIEEPVDLPEYQPSSLPGVNISPITSANAAERDMPFGGDADSVSQSTKTPVLQPSRVRTVSVNSDGSLVRQAAMPGSGTSVEASAAEAGTQDEAAAQAAGTPAPDVPVPGVRPAQGGDAVASDGSRPDPVQVASLDRSGPATASATGSPARAAGAGADEEAADRDSSSSAEPFDGYYVQISSQPSREAAEATSATLGKRYASVLGNRDRIIREAELDGRGTYYRVRVPVGAQEEASSLCSDLKSAGGSCFVSR